MCCSLVLGCLCQPLMSIVRSSKHPHAAWLIYDLLTSLFLSGFEVAHSFFSFSFFFFNSSMENMESHYLALDLGVKTSSLGQWRSLMGCGEKPFTGLDPGIGITRLERVSPGLEVWCNEDCCCLCLWPSVLEPLPQTLSLATIFPFTILQ